MVAESGDGANDVARSGGTMEITPEIPIFRRRVHDMSSMMISRQEVRRMRRFSYMAALFLGVLSVSITRGLVGVTSATILVLNLLEIITRSF